MEDAIKTQNILTCKNFCMYFELPFIKLGYLWKGKKKLSFWSTYRTKYSRVDKLNFLKDVFYKIYLVHS